MSPLTEQILKSKRERRQTLARLSFPEKVRIVEKLRAAALMIGSASKGANFTGSQVQMISLRGSHALPSGRFKRAAAAHETAPKTFSHPAKKDT